MKRLFLSFIFVLFGQGIALGAEFDPECSQEADLSVEYDATRGVRFCAPILDDAGSVLPDDALTRCVVDFNGTEVPVESITPGSKVEVATPSAIAWNGNVRVWCETAAGAGEVVAVAARFPARKPSKPRLVP